MLLQAMVLITTMVVLAGVLLTSTLASAHAAFHEMILAKTQTATNDATARFATWAQDQVIRYGTQQSWPTTPQPSNPDSTVGIVTPLCGTLATRESTSACSLVATTRWNVTGWSAKASPGREPKTGNSIATNLSTTLHEQRISATVTVVITNPTTQAMFATHSRQVTARIFDAYPYVTVTAMHDASSEELATAGKEGDTAGTLYHVNVGRVNENLPDQNLPSNFIDTTITTKIDCDNTILNQDGTEPKNDSHLGTYQRIRDVGNQAWVYEAPCTPMYTSRINLAGAPPDYQPAYNNVYSNSTTLPSSLWQKGGRTSSFSK